MKFLLALILLCTPAAALAQTATTPNWVPFHAFIGTWQGTRSSPDGSPVKIERTYETGEGSRELDVVERIGKAASPWGTVRFDDKRGAFVLERPETGDDPVELILVHVSEDGSELTFLRSSTEAPGRVERITQRRQGWNEFVEIVESASDGKQFNLISETHFHRK